MSFAAEISPSLFKFVALKVMSVCERKFPKLLIVAAVAVIASPAIMLEVELLEMVLVAVKTIVLTASRS
jgi:hypothetical protein